MLFIIPFLIVFELIHIFIYKTHENDLYQILSIPACPYRQGKYYSFVAYRIKLNVIFLLVMRICFIMSALIMAAFFELCF